MNHTEQATLITRYAPLARQIAGGFQRRLPRNVLRDDLIAAGMSGLWDAVRKHGDEQAESFDWYVRVRIRGAILDELRAQDWLPRRARKAQPGEPVPIVVVRGPDAAEFQLRSWEECIADGRESAEERCVRNSELGRIRKAMTQLPWRMQRILQLHYQRGAKFLHIAHELGVSEPRISQLHARAIARLRAILEEEDKHEHRGVDRGAGDPPEEDPGTGTFQRGVPGRGLGESPAAAAHRPVPGGAGSAELHRAPRPRLRGSHCAVRAPAAAADPGDGGVAVSALEEAPAEGLLGNAPDAVPSVLPEQGLDLQTEINRYRRWLIDQAMLQSGGRVDIAARLLKLAPCTLSQALRRAFRRRVGGVKSVDSPSEPAVPPPPKAALADRIDWAQVARLRAGGLGESLIARKLATSLDAHWCLVEKVLRRHPATDARES